MTSPESHLASGREGTTLFTQTGAAYFPLAILSRLPYAMVVVGVLTLLVAARGSMEVGGFGSAMVGIGAAMVGPLVGAAADRFGQRPTLLIVAALNSAALCALVGIAYSSAPTWAVLVAAFVVGATVPQTSPMSRSRLVTIVVTKLPAARAPRTLSTVLAYESTADEVVFVFGPVVVGLLATSFGAGTPIIAAAILTLVFVVAFALHRTAARARTREERAATLAPARDLLRAPLVVSVLGIFSVGLVFGTVLTALTAFMEAQGDPESAGILYGVMGLGSAVFAISVALITPRFTPRYRWLVFAACIAAGLVLLSQSTNLTALIAGLLLTGVGIGPLLVTIYGFGAARSPEGRSATVMTMLGSAIMLGQALSAAATGWVAESWGAESALLVPLGAGALILITGAANWMLTGPSRTARGPGTE